MGRITTINKSRKENKCGRCGAIIPVGSKYYKGEMNFSFSKPIIRCEKCKLERWEVTTSEYKLAVGEIAYRWQENYGLDDTTPDSIVSDLQDIYDETESKLNNMPESLQESDTGQILQERMDNLQSAIDELESIDIDSLKSQSAEEYEREYDDILGDDLVDESTKAELIEAFESELSAAIEEALAVIEI